MNKLLKILIKNKNNYISGNELGIQLGISRAMIHKSINKLKKEGHLIVSSTKKGYCYLNQNCITRFRNFA